MNHGVDLRALFHAKGAKVERVVKLAAVRVDQGLRPLFFMIDPFFFKLEFTSIVNGVSPRVTINPQIKDDAFIPLANRRLNIGGEGQWLTDIRLLPFVDTDKSKGVVKTVSTLAESEQDDILLMEAKHGLLPYRQCFDRQ